MEREPLDDRQLDALLEDARQTWRVPPVPPLDAMWTGVADQLATPVRAAPGWRVVGLAAAAALMVGVVGGRVSATHSAAVAARVSRTSATALPALPAASDDPNQRTMGELLGRTAVLLAALPGDSTRTVDPAMTHESEKLLTQTRLLLDSPVASDPRLRNLLLDLELVLAQVARIEPQRRTDDMVLIQAALDDRDIVPRLRSAVADLSLDDF
ncbi:MAG TPA: hypothetical protein VHW65_08110 [Gemmatimonadales bacterium]|jgi:hypothetical protein|nr:hypothetical protein [Gemmatimonadales bacterium]